jgi:hypothetical protein
MLKQRHRYEIELYDQVKSLIARIIFALKMQFDGRNISGAI